MTEETTKRIWIEDSIINYQVGDSFHWTLPIADLVILGEYTDPNGPYVDDYFFVFITQPEHRWNEASFYANGRDESLNELGGVLGIKLASSLVRSTDYNSRVMWPPKLEGIQLFEFIAVETKGDWEKLKHKLIPEYYFAFTTMVRDYLNARENNGV